MGQVNNKKIEQLICACAALGANPFIKIRKIYPKISLFADEAIAGLMYYYAKSLGEQLSIITSSGGKNENYLLGHARFFQSKSFFIKANCDALILCDISQDTEASIREKYPKIELIKLSDLLTEAYYDVSYFDPICNIKNNNPGVTVMVCGSFSVRQLSKKSEHEKQINTFAAVLEENFENSDFIDPVFKIYGKDREYYDSVLKHSGVLKRRGGVLSFDDSGSNQYQNFVDGRRVTTDTPAQYDNTIWMLGSSRIKGSGSEDAFTIPSCLQRILNDSGSRVRTFTVVNCANYSAGADEEQIKLLESLPLVSGDIVVSMVSEGRFRQLCEKPIEDIHQCDWRQALEWTNRDQEVFVGHTHVNFVGNQLLAEYLFDALNENDAFSKSASTHEKQLDCHLEKQTFYDIPDEYQESLNEYLLGLQVLKPQIGSIVMNCNPFTLGHRYLIEYASEKCNHLFIFVVEEDRSYFSFKDRLILVKEGTKDLKNVTVLPSGQFIISQITFREYSDKSELQDAIIDPSMDVEIFGGAIAPALGINIRFAGEEPLDNVTNQYNDAMKRILPTYGIEFEVIPRKTSDEEVISASRVRRLLEEKDFKKISSIVPATTLSYLKKMFQSEE